MLEEASARRLVVKLRDDHVVENRGNGKESLGCLAKVRKAIVVEKNLLNNKGGNCLTQLRATFHDAKAERNYLRLKKEADYLGVVNFHECADDAERGEPEVLEAAAFADRVEEWVQEERDMRPQEQLTSLAVRCHTLK